MAFKIVPQYDRVAIVRDPKVTKVGALWVPTIAQKDMFLGRVLAVGQGKLLTDGSFHKTHYNRGDWVLFGRYAGADIENFFMKTSDGQDIFFIKEEDIYAIIEEVREGEVDVPLVQVTRESGVAIPSPTQPARRRR
jgi:chaperonin GroES